MRRSTIYFLSISFVFLSACSKKDSAKPAAIIDAQSVSLHYDETHQYSVTNTSGLTWSSSDATVGTINSSGLFSARKIGTTTIKGTTNNVSVQSVVTVTPYSTMCAEPVFIPGTNLSTIKRKESRILHYESAASLFYTGENSKLRLVEYVFNDTGLTAAALLLSNSSAVMNETSVFLKERYTLLGGDGTFIFFTGDNNLVIGVSNDPTLGFNALYFRSASPPKVNSIPGLNKLRMEAILSLKNKIVNAQ